MKEHNVIKLIRYAEREQYIAIKILQSVFKVKQIVSLSTMFETAEIFKQAIIC